MNINTNHISLIDFYFFLILFIFFLTYYTNFLYVELDLNTYPRHNNDNTTKIIMNIITRIIDYFYYN
jgi:hypothetical protein